MSFHVKNIVIIKYGDRILKTELYAANKDIFYELLNYSHSNDTTKNKSVLFFLGPELDSTLPCKSNNRNKINVKKYEMKSSIFFNFNLVSSQMRAYA